MEVDSNVAPKPTYGGAQEVMKTIWTCFAACITFIRLTPGSSVMAPHGLVLLQGLTVYSSEQM